MGVNMKERCAKEALKWINNQTTIGLGGGSTISFLANYIKDAGLDVNIVTPSIKTETLCRSLGLNIIPTNLINHIDIAFDGCDEVDYKLNALKSGGGIHTKEKLIATMADEYILLVDESKVSEQLKFHVPVVLEIIPESQSYIEHKMTELGGVANLRCSTAKDGYVISDHGLYLMDVTFKHVDDVKDLHNSLSSIPGILETSLFYQIATKAIVINETGYNLLEKK